MSLSEQEVAAAARDWAPSPVPADRRHLPSTVDSGLQSAIRKPTCMTRLRSAGLNEQLWKNPHVARIESWPSKWMSCGAVTQSFLQRKGRALGASTDRTSGGQAWRGSLERARISEPGHALTDTYQGDSGKLSYRLGDIESYALCKQRVQKHIPRYLISDHLLNFTLPLKFSSLVFSLAPCYKARSSWSLDLLFLW